MKRLLGISVIIILALVMTSCKEKTIDLNKVYSNLDIEYKDFNKMDKNSLEGVYGIDTSKFEDFIVVMDKTSNKGSMYAVFKSKEKDVDTSEYEAEYFIDRYKESWSLGYFPDETKLVNDGVTEKYGEYIIFVVNKDPDKIISKIKNSK